MKLSKYIVADVLRKSEPSKYGYDEHYLWESIVNSFGKEFDDEKFLDLVEGKTNA